MSTTFPTKGAIAIVHLLFANMITKTKYDDTKSPICTLPMIEPSQYLQPSQVGRIYQHPSDYDPIVHSTILGLTGMSIRNLCSLKKQVMVIPNELGVIS